MRLRLTSLAVPVVVLLGPALLRAQQPTNPPPAAPAIPVPEVGAVAPDFSFRGATRFGVLRDPMKLSDFKGQTVVLWFFIKARTRG